MSDDAPDPADSDLEAPIGDDAATQPAVPVALDLSPHWGLDGSITYLNHGAFGACPRRIRHERQALLDQLESNPTRFFGRELPRLINRARAEAADFVGADPDHFAFLTNTTEGINTVLRSLDLGPGDQILITDHGYGACANAARFVAERTGAELRVATLPFPVGDPAAVVDAIADSVTDRTRLAIVDHITAFSAMVLPIADIVDALKSRGVPTLVDGAHAPGMVDLDVEAIGAAFYVGNFHKWLCAPRGAAFLHVDPEFIDQIRPLVISHGASRPTTDASRFHLEFDWQGTRDVTPWLVVPQAIDFLKSLVPGGWAGIFERNHNLAIYGRDKLCEVLDSKPLCPDPMVGFTAAVELPAIDPMPNTPFEADPLQEALLREEGVEVPIFVLLDPPRRLLRLSAHLHNRRRDYDRLASALAHRL